VVIAMMDPCIIGGRGGREEGEWEEMRKGGWDRRGGEKGMRRGGGQEMEGRR